MADTLDRDAKARVLLQCGARVTPDAARKASTSLQFRNRSPADLQAVLSLLHKHDWQFRGAQVCELRQNLEGLVARVLFAELHGCAAVGMYSLCIKRIEEMIAVMCYTRPPCCNAAVYSRACVRAALVVTPCCVCATSLSA
jgi:hypothetical protein